MAILLLALSAAAVVACGGDNAADEPAGVLPTNTPSVSSPTSEPSEQPANPGSSKQAPDFTLPNANGPEVTLSKLSSEQPVVLVFYRAFW